MPEESSADRRGSLWKALRDELSIRMVVQIIITFCLLGFGFYVLLTTDWKENPEFAAAAAGWIGLVTGYWLR